MVHYALAYVVIGSVLLHVGIKLPDIVYGLRAKLPEADVLTEIPWNENPDSHSNAGDLPAPPTPGLSRRGVLAAAGAGLGVVVVGHGRADADPAGTARSAGAPAAEPGPARPAGRQDRRGGPGVGELPRRLALRGDRTAAVRADPGRGRGAGRWSRSGCPSPPTRAGAAPRSWRGLRLLDLVQRAGGTAASRVRVLSLEPRGPFNKSRRRGRPAVPRAAGHPPQRGAAHPITATRCG